MLQMRGIFNSSKFEYWKLTKIFFRALSAVRSFRGSGLPSSVLESVLYGLLTVSEQDGSLWGWSLGIPIIN